MNDQSYIEGIATIIQNYRRTELTKPLDAAHVERWVGQFAPDERSIVLAETFHALTRYYFKEERIHNFLERVLERITADNVVFASIQEKGHSQKLIYEYIASKGNFTFQSEEFTDTSKLYVYIDDGLYSGGRAKEDLRKLIGLLPQGAHLQVYYLIAYSNGFDYWSNRFSQEAAGKGICLEFFCEKKYINDRTKESEKYEFLWPDVSSHENEQIAEYERKLKETGKLFYPYCSSAENPGVCSSAETNKQLTAIFLKYGIKIARRLRRNTFLPLGLGYPLSFGFGAFCANDWNIPNNCPLVLWWGDIDDPQSMVGSWYPLLPRRDNRKLYQEVCQFEDDLSIAGNMDVLKTVYRLSVDEYRNHREAENSWADMLEHFDIHEPYRKRQASDLYQYMNGLDMDVIKIIQTIMYIGRDYSYERDIQRYYQESEQEDNGGRERISLKVDNPDFLLSVWMEDLTWAKGWEAKDIEIEQIYSKRLCLYKYFKRAFEILGIE